MESNNDYSISMSRTSSLVEAGAIVGTPSMIQDENLNRWIQEQAEPEREPEQENPAGLEGRTDTLGFQIRIQQKRRRILRQMHKDIGTTINSYTVVLVLLGSVTFVVFLQPPGGLGDDGHMKQKGPIVTLFANIALMAFLFSVAGIVVCMSCVAFVLPRSTQYARHMLLAEMELQVTAVGLSSIRQKVLDIEMKTNDRISRILKVAHIHQVLGNLFFSLSLGASVEAFIASAIMVIDAETIHSLKSPYWSIATLTLQGVYLLYILLLFLHIVKVIIDLLVDFVKLIKRFSLALGVRLKKLRTLLRSL